jgi:EAL domain-containing protein (putative c-di-GMP-specific phosphodiesterase class I)
MKGLECQFGQGFLFSKPMEPGAIDSWMQAEELRIGKKLLPVNDI